MNRPKTIIWFDWLYLSSFIISYVGDYVVEGNVFEFFFIELIAFGIAYFFWYMIVRQMNDLFKWIFIIMALIQVGILGWALTANVIEFQILDNELLGMSATEIIFGIVVNILNMATTVCLLSKPSQRWFETQGISAGDGDDPSGAVQ